MEGKVGNERLMVRVYGKEKYYPLVTQIRGKEEYQINQYLPKEVKRALGKISSRKILEEEIKNLSDGIIANKQAAEDSSASLTERNKARARAKTQINKRTALARELDELK